MFWRHQQHTYLNANLLICQNEASIHELGHDINNLWIWKKIARILMFSKILYQCNSEIVEKLSMTCARWRVYIWTKNVWWNNCCLDYKKLVSSPDIFMFLHLYNLHVINNIRLLELFGLVATVLPAGHTGNTNFFWTFFMSFALKTSHFNHKVGINTKCWTQ